MDSPRTPDFERLIADVSCALGARGVPFMLIGGQAVLLDGEPPSQAGALLVAKYRRPTVSWKGPTFARVTDAAW